MVDVGQRIRQARLSKGLSQSALAEQTNVSQPTVANWERGSHAPRHAALSKIATVLDASAAWIMTGESRTMQARPVHHHIPVLDWPRSPGEIDTAHVTDYVAATTSARRPFAIAAPQDSQFSTGTVLIFDRARQTAEPRGVYLATSGTDVTLIDTADGGHTDAEILARLVLSVQPH